MDANDRAAIERLFARLAAFEDRGVMRDPQAEAFIARRLRDQPGAAYFMAQTIIAQEEALKNAGVRLADGDGAPVRHDGPSARPGPWASGAAGGFLAGAAQTAMGVAGGLMLAGAISGLFGDDAEAPGDPFAETDDDGADL